MVSLEWQVNQNRTRVRFWPVAGYTDRHTEYRSNALTHSLMIVDDSRVSRMMIRARIQAVHPDWTFVEAASGDEAVDMVAQNPPDSLTMDMNMPGLNGFDAAEKVKALAPSVKMVMLTANIQESSRQRAEAMGMKFVQKPITDASIQQVLAFLAET